MSCTSERDACIKFVRVVRRFRGPAMRVARSTWSRFEKRDGSPSQEGASESGDCTARGKRYHMHDCIRSRFLVTAIARHEESAAVRIAFILEREFPEIVASQ
jgi:hypothetical protein